MFLDWKSTQMYVGACIPGGKDDAFIMFVHGGEAFIVSKYIRESSPLPPSAAHKKSQSVQSLFLAAYNRESSLVSTPRNFLHDEEEKCFISLFWFVISTFG